MMPLHEMDPENRFTTRAEAYRRHRPDYPAALFARILRNHPSTVADIGAGTGISSLQIAVHGPLVFAVEPNGAMREAGLMHPSIRWIDGSAVSTGLEDHSVDLVTCFQSFHWFDPQPAIDEFLRILRPEGSIVAVWNERDPADPFTAAYGELIREISDNHPAEARENTVSALYESPLLGDVLHERFPHHQILDLEGLIGRASSTSYLPSSGPRFEEMGRRLERLHREWSEGGVVVLRYLTSSYTTGRG